MKNADAINDAIKIYYLGIENEFKLDNHAMIKDDVDMNGYVIARYLKARNYIKNNRMVPHILKVIIKLWWAIHLIVTMINFTKTFVRSVLNQNKKVLKHEEIFVLGNNRAYSIFERLKGDHSVLYLSVPWVKIPHGNNIAKTISIFDILENNDIIWALRRSLNIRKTHKKKFASINQSITLQTYDSFNWFLLYRVLEKIEPSCIWFINHYDRWAIMYDSIHGKSSKKQIQHGIIDKEILIPNKLKNVEECYCLDAESIEIFKTNYHDNTNKKTIYKIVNNCLKLLDTGISKSILFIGGPFDSEHEKSIINKISKELKEYTIFIKPHPSYPIKFYSNLEKDNIVIIKEKDFYPIVKFAVSYRSTLAYDYEKHRIPVVYHEGKTQEAIIIEINGIDKNQ
ncbi:hypothetical protein [Fusibacter ferrireducens]|uniref:Glycosyltransferase family 52 n=1 Tax=Fusibacter ferrireducens TaxID=2785058 RepID=A0ABR9ZXF7_9FIRM|nr:hypothetical protein [Fusibacter ferrireducens]MBF4695140.1 hypothetical protein [Fusibacter ferrireducens]